MRRTTIVLARALALGLAASCGGARARDIYVLRQVGIVIRAQVVCDNFYPFLPQQDYEDLIGEQIKVMTEIEKAASAADMVMEADDSLKKLGLLDFCAMAKIADQALAQRR